MGRASGEREWMVDWRSSMAIWWVSRSDSFEREVRIFCFSSTIARWEETDEDLENWFGDFMGFEEEEEDLGSWELIVIFSLGVNERNVLCDQFLFWSEKTATFGGRKKLRSGLCVCLVTDEIMEESKERSIFLVFFKNFRGRKFEKSAR